MSIPVVDRIVLLNGWPPRKTIRSTRGSRKRYPGIIIGAAILGSLVLKSALVLLVGNRRPLHALPDSLALGPPSKDTIHYWHPPDGVVCTTPNNHVHHGLACSGFGMNTEEEAPRRPALAPATLHIVVARGAGN